MELDSDALAGVCDLFGGLTRAELARAVAELAARRGADFDRDAHDDAVAAAIESYVLVTLALPEDDDDALDAYVAAVLGDAGFDPDEPLLVPGPLAFPVVPDGAEDLPHILDVPRRDVPSEAVEAVVRDRLEQEVAALDAASADPERVALLLDVTYDAEALTGGDFGGVRAELDSLRAS